MDVHLEVWQLVAGGCLAYLAGGVATCRTLIRFIDKSDPDVFPCFLGWLFWPLTAVLGLRLGIFSVFYRVFTGQCHGHDGNQERMPASSSAAR